MKKIVIIFVALQIIGLGLGYGAGLYLDKPDEPPTASAEEGGHGTQADAGSHSSDGETGEKSHVVGLGRMVIPVYKAKSVSYIVANVGVSVSTLESAEYYNIGENGVKLRDVIFTSLKHTADGRDLRGSEIDTEKLSETITANLKPKFNDIDKVMFLDFYKKDIARS